jgi:hypothetical protein
LSLTVIRSILLAVVSLKETNEYEHKVGEESRRRIAAESESKQGGASEPSDVESGGESERERLGDTEEEKRVLAVLISENTTKYH